jgi:predicted transcriptional regulator
LDKLFFELASENRLGIMLELQGVGFRMHEIARRLNMTDTETCRQLQRLSEALLIKKQPDGTYSITNYGKLALLGGANQSSICNLNIKGLEYFN